VLRRSLAPALAAAVALVLAAPAAALSVHVRVEGLTRTLFGRTEPLVTVFTGALAADGSTVTLSEPTALGALEAASREAEFFYRLHASAFGPYVGQVGRYGGSGASGWVYKVNGVSPPVGAADYVLKDGDTVLWYYATFGAAGGPPTLELEETADGDTRCFQAVARDDAGKATTARGVVYLVDGRRIRDADGRRCLNGTSWRKLRVTKAGAIPSRLILRAA
jgi:hypothetical protein